MKIQTLFNFICKRKIKLPKGVLSFSKYRIANSLFIQNKLATDRNPFNDPYTFRIADYYVDYLLICGIDIRERFRELHFKCNRSYISYDQKIYDNLNDIMDHITDTDYLFKNYNL